ncbi:MAG: AbrB/MazE/SpoVT family DNA-binding domain-containing protein [Chloroflexi bacterium]|nr:AbrB/MazE/SpoVT family DNA-binding domain-containing protein [Chloroflexota bacterium]
MLVSRNGNSRTLTIPAEVAEREQIEVGETFYVEAGPEGLFYRRAKGLLPGRRFVGEGAERFLALPEGAALAAGEDPAPLAPIDWDY